jgi:hypothetical protein
VLLTYDDGIVDFNLRPGALNKGGVNGDGKPLVGHAAGGRASDHQRDDGRGTRRSSTTPSL